MQLPTPLGACGSLERLALPSSSRAGRQSERQQQQQQQRNEIDMHHPRAVSMQLPARILPNVANAAPCGPSLIPQSTFGRHEVARGSSGQASARFEAKVDTWRGQEGKGRREGGAEGEWKGKWKGELEGEGERESEGVWEGEWKGEGKAGGKGVVVGVWEEEDEVEEEESRGSRRSFLAAGASGVGVCHGSSREGVGGRRRGGGSEELADEAMRVSDDVSKGASQPTPPLLWSRRQAVHSPLLLSLHSLLPSFLLPLSACPPPAIAAAPVDSADSSPSSAVPLSRQLLRGLGIGDGDIYYPQVFEGEWRCTSKLVSVETPQGSDVADMRAVEASRRSLGVPLVYSARFFDFNGNIVGDRLFTTISLVEATVGEGVVESADWSPSRPNLLTLTLRGGLKVQNLVTRRSSLLSAAGQFDSSEYSKQVFDNSRLVDGPPSVKASSNLTRYRWDPSAQQVNLIEAFQRVSMFPVVGGIAEGRPEGLSTMDYFNLGMGDKPTTVYKYLLRLERKS